MRSPPARSTRGLWPWMLSRRDSLSFPFHRTACRLHRHSRTLVWLDTVGQFLSAFATKPGMSALHWLVDVAVVVEVKLAAGDGPRSQAIGRCDRSHASTST